MFQHVNEVGETVSNIAVVLFVVAFIYAIVDYILEKFFA